MRPTNFIESLPDDVLLKIFVDHLSAEEIHESARPVCRKWYQMTNTDSFINSHLRRTDYVLIFRSLSDTLSLSLLHGRVKMSKFRNKFGGLFSQDCCNGLMLGQTFPNVEGDHTFYIRNPITNRSCVIPPISKMNSWSYCIAIAEASMVSKVVVISTPGRPNSTQLKYCRILTVGVDNSWRSVSSEHLTHAAKIAFFVCPLVTEGGFLHWCRKGDDRILTIDVEREIIKETPPPFPAVDVDGQRGVYLSTGKYLSFLVSRGEYLWQVWEMEPQTGEWRMVTDFSLEAWKCMFERFGLGKNEYIAPIGWLMYPQVLVFGFSYGNKADLQVFPYNLVTKEIESIRLPEPRWLYTCFLYKSSLVRV